MNNKYIFLLFSQFLIVPAFAQATIYKCSDNEGNISYTTDKVNNCSKTNLGTVDRSTTLNKISNFPTLKSNVTPIEDKVVSNEQKLKDQKRAMILQGELTQEKNELKTVSDMLKKIEKGGDQQQLTQLKGMEELHKKNIASLQKELGNGVEMVTPHIANTPKGLPIALPSDETQQELIASVAPKKQNETKKTTPSVSLANTNTPKTIQPIQSIPKKIEATETIRVSNIEPALITNHSIKKKFVPLDFTHKNN